MADTELTRIDKWLFSTLTAVGTGITGLVPATNIWNSLVPQGLIKANPGQKWVTYHNQGNGTDVLTANDTRAMTNIVYLVRVFGEAQDYGFIENEAYAIDLCINKKSSTTTLSCVRQRPFKQMERAETGEIFVHLGGFYRIFAQ